MKYNKIYVIFLLTIATFFSCSIQPSSKQSSDPSNSSSIDTSYSVTTNGIPINVETLKKFDVPVSYVHFDFNSESINIEITVKEPFDPLSLKIRPFSKNITPSISGNKISFKLNQPEYLVLEIPNKERLFILVNPKEINPPKLGAPNVKSIMEYAGIDNTGVKTNTEIIQIAIEETASENKILYFPPGRYKTKAIFPKNNSKIYLSSGAILECVEDVNSLVNHPSGYVIIENCSRGFIHFKDVTNAMIYGRGTIDGNGKFLRTGGKMFLIKMENSHNCIIEGVISRDSAFWNTLTFRCSSIAISNYKVINNRLKNEWNETDGVNFDNSVNCLLYNAFLYTGDDAMAVKSDDLIDGQTYTTDPYTGPYMNVSNVVHRKIVCYGYGGCKIGTKTYGEYITEVVFEDIDILDGIRGIVIDGVDTALIKNNSFKNIRIEKVTAQLVSINIDVENIFWRKALGLCTISNTIISNLRCNLKKEIYMVGTDHNWITDTNNPAYGSTNYVDGVYFYDLYINNNKIISLDDPNANFKTNNYVRNIFFY